MTTISFKRRYDALPDIIGEGSYGKVYRGIDNDTGSPVAIKVQSDRKAACIESKMLSAVQCLPHILSLRSSFTSSPQKMPRLGHPIVTDFIATPNLREFYRQSKTLAFADIITIFKQCLESLMYLSERHIYMGDIKPENLIFEIKSRHLTLIDLGLSGFADRDRRTHVQTSYYRAPEVILNQSNDPSMDLWSLGCVVYELFVEEILFSHPRDNYNSNYHLHKIAFQIGLPTKDYIEKSQRGLQYFTTEPDVQFNEPVPFNVIHWKERIREKGAAKKLYSPEIESFIRLLEKLLAYERPTPKELLEDPFFVTDVSFRLNPHPFKTIAIYRADKFAAGDDPDLVIEADKVARRCFHVPAHPDNQYVFILDETSPHFVSFTNKAFIDLNPQVESPTRKKPRSLLEEFELVSN